MSFPALPVHITAGVNALHTYWRTLEAKPDVWNCTRQSMRNACYLAVLCSRCNFIFPSFFLAGPCLCWAFG